MDDDKPQLPAKKAGPHRYTKGTPKITGRTAGTPNKIPRLIKEAVMMAAELEGSNQHGKDKLVGFMRRVAREDLRAFVTLLRAAMPLQIESRSDMKVEVTYRTVAEVRRELASRGISIETVTRILHQPPEEIEAPSADLVDDDIITVEMDEQIR